MKNIFLLLSLVFCSNLHAQTLDDIGRLSINVYQPKRENLTEESRRLLETKMQQIISVNGIADRGLNNRFVITAKINILNKDIIAGSPSRVSQKVEITYTIGDIIENKIYGTETLTTTGVGLNENKSFIAAIKTINAKNPLLKTFIEDAKQLIVSYYQTNCESIISSAYTDVGQQQYEHALYRLAQVPNVCMECYIRCQQAMVDIYHRRIDFYGQELLNRAKATWAQSPNIASADEVTSLLSKINIFASCQPQVQVFLDEIKGKLTADEKREWEFKLQQYEDQKRREQRDFEFKKQQYEDQKIADAQRQAEASAHEQREFEFRQEQYRTDAEIEKQTIAAARDAAIEFAKNTPETMNYNNTILW